MGHDVVDRVLELLRQWGWERGLDKMREELFAGAPAAGGPIEHLFCGWFAAERGQFDEALASLAAAAESPRLAPWAMLGQAFVATRARRLDDADAFLRRAEELSPDDPYLLGGIRLMQGVAQFHRGDGAALPLLEEAYRLVPETCFSHGRVLDALGMYYASHNVLAALEFFTRALDFKRRFEDDAGLALTYGQLGRLHLDWGQYELAEQHFRADLECCRRIEDRRGEAQMYNFLGKVALERDQLDEAVAYLSEAVEIATESHWTVPEAFARTDLARALTRRRQAAEAQPLLDRAAELFGEIHFEEGLAHVQTARGALLRLEREHRESERALRRALAFFEQAGQLADAARTRLELARTLRDRGAPGPLVRDEFIAALDSAERSRRPQLVARADQELAEADPATAAKRIYQRVRGRRIDEDSTSLTRAEREIASVMFFDLQGFTTWSRDTDPSVVMLSINQMMSVFLDAMSPHEVQVTDYTGDGFLAVARGTNHASRALESAFELYQALDRFNRPRRLLGLDEFECRIGISSGELVMGNVGTYERLGYTAIGATVNFAARIQHEALPGTPCVSQTTWEHVRGEFQASADSPRRLQLKGLGERLVWDILPPAAPD